MIRIVDLPMFLCAGALLARGRLVDALVVIAAALVMGWILEPQGVSGPQDEP